jgi:chromosome segregation ATPase
MSPNVSCRVDDDLNEWIEETADERNCTKTDVLKDALDVARQVGFDPSASEREENLRKRVEQLEHDYNAARRVVDRLEAHVDDLRAENERLSEQLEAEQREAEAYQALVETVDGHSNELREVSRQIKQELHEHDQQVQDYGDQLSDEITNIRAMRRTVRELESTVERINEREKKHMQTIRSLRRYKEKNLIQRLFGRY